MRSPKGGSGTKKFLPITAVTAGAVAFGLVAALDCAPASVWSSHWHDATDTGRILKYEVDPDTGDLTVISEVPVAHVYGDFAIETEDGDIWATDFLPAIATDRALYRIDPATGDEIDRLELDPMTMQNELNSLSFRADGKVYVASGWEMGIYIVDLTDGTWTQPNPAEFPELDASYDDHWPAGDFITLEDGTVLATANFIVDNLDPSTVGTYLVLFDFDAGTSQILGQTGIDLFGLAQSGQWLYLPGYDGIVYKMAVGDIPDVADPSFDITPMLSVAWDDPLDDNIFGIASPQDSGVCPAPTPSPTPSDTFTPTPSPSPSDIDDPDTEERDTDAPE